MTRKGFVRRGNRRWGVFIDAEDALKWGRHAWIAYFCAIDSAEKSMAMYKKYGGKVWKRLARKELAQARECRELCYALAGPRKIYREEYP